MKKTKILITLLALVLLVGALLTAGIVANATEIPVSLSFKACNLSFEDSVYLKYAVAYEGVEYSEVKLLIFKSPEGSEAEYTADKAVETLSPIGTTTVSGTNCAVFQYRGLNAKNMTDNLYARAYVKQGEVEYYSPVLKYSILEYAYNKLGYTGTATTNLKFEKLLRDMLAYGASSQDYFGYNTDRLASARYAKVTVSGGRFADGTDKDFIKIGDSLTLYADTYSKWYDADGALVGKGESITMVVNGNKKYIAESVEYYEVKFLDFDGQTLSSQQVPPNGSAVAPQAPFVKGYSFVGWDTDFSQVGDDLEIKALYEPCKNQIVIEYTENQDGSVTAIGSIYGSPDFCSLEAELELSLDGCEVRDYSCAETAGLSEMNYTGGTLKYSLISAEPLTDAEELFTLTFESLEESFSIEFSRIEISIFGEDLLIEQSYETVIAGYGR